MVEQIVKAFPDFRKEAKKDGSGVINISEMFADTVQGEGINTGCPATFLRVQHCTLDCGWCDTGEVWKKGNPYSVDEIIELMEQKYNNRTLIDRFKQGQHLVLTGGSPMLYQNQFVELVNKIKNKYSFKPYIEIENEATRMPTKEFSEIIDCWNNSPKLENSGMKKSFRNKPEVIKYLVQQPNSWFKFVITDKSDWNEITKEYIKPDNSIYGVIPYSKIILMPEGQTRQQLQQNYDVVVDLCSRYNLRMTDRMHISMWDKKTGV